MPKCQKCNHNWSWKETMKSMWTLDTGCKCPKCTRKQYPTKQSRKRSMIAIFMTPLSILLVNLLGLNLIGAYLLFFGIAAAVIMTLPFYTEVQNEEEAMW